MKKYNENHDYYLGDIITAEFFPGSVIQILGFNRCGQQATVRWITPTTGLITDFKLDHTKLLRSRHAKISRRNLEANQNFIYTII